MPILECLKLCRINSSRKAVSENWLSHTTVGSCNNSRFAFLLLTNDLDLHFSILVETHMRKIGGLIFLHSSRVFEFYPVQQYKAECPIWYISYFLHFVSFIPPVSPRKTELCLKPSLGYIWLSSSYYMAEVWYEQSEVTWSLWINAAHKLTHCFIAKAPWSSSIFWRLWNASFYNIVSILLRKVYVYTLKSIIL